MRAVNLLPRDEGRKRRQPGAVSLTAILGAVLVTAVLCGWFLMASSGVTDKRGELDARKAELLAIPLPDAPDTSQSTLVAEKDARLEALGKALSGRIAWDRILREVSLVIPDDVWLETMTSAARSGGAERRRVLQHHGLHVLARRRRQAPRAAVGHPAPPEGEARLEPARCRGPPGDREVHRHGRPPPDAGGVVKQRIPKPAAIALVVVGLLVAAALGYFLLISPQRSESADLATQIAATETEMQTRRLALRAKPDVEQIKAADLFRVTKAMPNRTDMPGVLLELNRIARDTGIRFESITPGDGVDSGGYLRQPVDLIFQGNFYELSDFLYRMRTLVSVHNGRLSATGRLFTVRSLSFVEGEKGFPAIKATIGVDAYVYGTGEATTPPPAATPPAAQPPAAQPPAAATPPPTGSATGAS